MTATTTDTDLGIETIEALDFEPQCEVSPNGQPCERPAEWLSQPFHAEDVSLCIDASWYACSPCRESFIAEIDRRIASGGIIGISCVAHRRPLHEIRWVHL